MKWIRFFSAVVVTVSMSTTAQADLFDHLGGGKSCGCAPSYQPTCCKPTITRPACPPVRTYQRQCSDIKPPCVRDVCAPKCCAPAPKACAAPKPKACKAPRPKPQPQPCAAPKPACGPKSSCGPKCGPQGVCAPSGCCQPCDVCCCDVDPCEVAHLIYQSQTACYADDREDAIHDLGDNFNCICSPEIMDAMIYALNDADEDVRAEAADEIGDQFREYGCECCGNQNVISALTAALADCDKDVRRQAEEALELCGYEIVDGCCDICSTGCGPCGSRGACGASGPAPAPTPAEDGEAAPAPAPPEADPKAYFPSRLRQKQTSRPSKSKRLANLFGLLD